MKIRFYPGLKPHTDINEPVIIDNIEVDIPDEIYKILETSIRVKEYDNILKRIDKTFMLKDRGHVAMVDYIMHLKRRVEEGRDE